MSIKAKKLRNKHIRHIALNWKKNMTLQLMEGNTDRSLSMKQLLAQGTIVRGKAYEVKEYEKIYQKGRTIARKEDIAFINFTTDAWNDPDDKEYSAFGAECYSMEDFFILEEMIKKAEEAFEQTVKDLGLDISYLVIDEKTVNINGIFIL